MTTFTPFRLGEKNELKTVFWVTNHFQFECLNPCPSLSIQGQFTLISEDMTLANLQLEIWKVLDQTDKIFLLNKIRFTGICAEKVPLL